MLSRKENLLIVFLQTLDISVTYGSDLNRQHISCLTNALCNQKRTRGELITDDGQFLHRSDEVYAAIDLMPPEVNRLLAIAAITLNHSGNLLSSAYSL